MDIVSLRFTHSCLRVSGSLDTHRTARHKLLAQGYQLGRGDLLNMDDHIKALR